MAAPRWIQRFKEERWNWIYYVAAASLIVGYLIFCFGWYGILAVPVLAGLEVVYRKNLRRRNPQLLLAELGEIEMEIAECRPSGAPSPKNQRRTLFIFGGLFMFVVLASAIDDLLSHTDTGKSLLTFAIKVCFVLLYGFKMYVSHESANIHLVVAESGLFRLVDPGRPWLQASDTCASNRRLGARKFYGWGEIERFHWSRHRRTGYTLHLSVRQPNFSFPQMISYDLPSLSDGQQHDLDQIFHQHIPSPAESHHPATV